MISNKCFEKFTNSILISEAPQIIQKKTFRTRDPPEHLVWLRLWVYPIYFILKRFFVIRYIHSVVFSDNFVNNWYYKQEIVNGVQHVRWAKKDSELNMTNGRCSSIPNKITNSLSSFIKWLLIAQCVLKIVSL